MAQKVSLADFAKAKAPPACRVCVLPERAEIDEAYRNGTPRRIILEWLWEVRGYKTSGLVDGVSEAMMDKHCKSQHHHKKPVGSGD